MKRGLECSKIVQRALMSSRGMESCDQWIRSGSAGKSGTTGEKICSGKKKDHSITLQVQLWKIDKVVYCDSFCVSPSSAPSGEGRNHVSMQGSLFFSPLHISLWIKVLYFFVFLFFASVSNFWISPTQVWVFKKLCLKYFPAYADLMKLSVSFGGSGN